jgi:hypothetical protein
MGPLVAGLVAPYIDRDAAFARFVSCTARSLVPHPRYHWEKRFERLLRALAEGTARFAIRMPPLHDLFCEARDEYGQHTIQRCLVDGSCVARLVGQLREAEDALDELLHPAFVTLETACPAVDCPAAMGYVVVARQ